MQQYSLVAIKNYGISKPPKNAVSITKKNIDDGTVAIGKVEKICDCVAEKMFAKYKSEAELDADKYNQMLPGKECVDSIEAVK